MGATPIFCECGCLRLPERLEIRKSHGDLNGPSSDAHEPPLREQQPERLEAGTKSTWDAGNLDIAFVQSTTKWPTRRCPSRKVPHVAADAPAGSDNTSHFRQRLWTIGNEIHDQRQIIRQP